MALSPSFDLSRAKLSPEETAVVQAIGRVRQISEVVAATALSEPRTIATLLALRAKGVIVPARVQVKASLEPSTAMLEQVELDDARKTEILEMERRLDTDDHFALLGVPRGSDPARVKAAFFELSRRHHPDRFFGKNIGSFKGRAEKIFKRLSDAHQTLVDPERRQRYLEANPQFASEPINDPTPVAPARPSAPAPVKPSAEDPRREAERRARMAKHPYLARHARVNELLLRAKAAVARGDFAAAHIDLVTASQGDERNQEIKTLLVDVKKKADAQRSKAEYERANKLEQATDMTGALAAYRTASNQDPRNAEAAYAVARIMARYNLDTKETSTYAQRAVEADPKKAEYQLLLAKLYEQAGMKQLAKKHFEETLALDPANVEAKNKVKGRWPF